MTQRYLTTSFYLDVSKMPSIAGSKVHELTEAKYQIFQPQLFFYFELNREFWCFKHTQTPNTNFSKYHWN